jgi:hypothetical protein
MVVQVELGRRRQKTSSNSVEMTTNLMFTTVAEDIISPQQTRIQRHNPEGHLSRAIRDNDTSSNLSKHNSLHPPDVGV